MSNDVVEVACAADRPDGLGHCRTNDNVKTFEIVQTTRGFALLEHFLYFVSKLPDATSM